MTTNPTVRDWSIDWYIDVFVIAKQVVWEGDDDDAAQWVDISPLWWANFDNVISYTLTSLYLQHTCARVAQKIRLQGYVRLSTAGDRWHMKTLKKRFDLITF